MQFKMIPCIYSGHLPDDVREELRDWNDLLCFHGDGGCVFRIDEDDLKDVPKFIQWLLSIGAIGNKDANIISFATWCNDNKKEMAVDSYKEYALLISQGVYRQHLEIAMTGT